MKILILALTLTLASFSAFAFRLEPMVAEFTPKAEGSSKVFRIENNGQSKIAIQLKMTTRKIQPNGEELREETSDFTVYPDQISLGPNDARNIRVTYKGPLEGKAEKSYRLIASQLPIDFKPTAQKTQLNFLFQYIASVYFRPEGTFPKLELSKVEALGDKKLKVTITNSGTAHRLLRNVKLLVKTEAGKQIALQDSSFKDWPGENLLVGGSRDFIVEAKEPIPQNSKIAGEIQILGPADSGN